MTRVTRFRTGLPVAAMLLLAACNGNKVGQAPEMTAIGENGLGMPIVSPERAAIAVPPPQPARYSYQQGSLWNTSPDGLLGDKRAASLGDILTIVIEIDDEAEMRNTSSRTRDGSEKASVDAFFGLGNTMPNSKINPNLELDSQSSYKGSGTVKRNEKLTLRVAATVVNVLPNGHLVIQGDQQVRVNYELRDLQVTGIVRPEDISRYNEISYDRIAGARISYGGRGQVSSVQQPRYGQQVMDILLPF